MGGRTDGRMDGKKRDGGGGGGGGRGVRNSTRPPRFIRAPRPTLFVTIRVGLENKIVSFGRISPFTKLSVRRKQLSLLFCVGIVLGLR